MLFFHYSKIENMRIGIYDPYLDDLGGGEKYMMTIAECLENEHEVDIFWDKRQEVKELINRFSLNLSKVTFVKNIFSPRVSLFERLIKTKKYDIIIILSDGSIPLSFSKKTFVHLQQPIPKAKLNLKNRIKILRINKFFCNSYYSKSYVDRSLGVNSAVLYPPIKIKKKAVKKENIILHVGRFRVMDVVTTVKGVALGIGDYKKQSVMVQAFKKMVKNGLKDWKLVFAISIKEKDQKSFQNFQKETAGFSIEFLINKTNDELWNIYSKAKIYWHASGFGEDLEKHPEYAEHFGISTVEAMGAGAVPVVINAGGQKEIVDDGENGFLWKNTNELIEKTTVLMQNVRLFEKMSKEAEEKSKIFSNDRFYKELKEIIKT